MYQQIDLLCLITSQIWRGTKKIFESEQKLSELWLFKILHEYRVASGTENFRYFKV